MFESEHARKSIGACTSPSYIVSVTEQSEGRIRSPRAKTSVDALCTETLQVMFVAGGNWSWTSRGLRVALAIVKGIVKPMSAVDAACEDKRDW
jgi:hypothetical protein